MKNKAISIGLVLIVSLAIANIGLFARSVILADSTVKIETNLEKLIAENEDLEHQLYLTSSFDSLSKKAVSLGFIKQAEPLYLENLRFAQAP